MTQIEEPPVCRVLKCGSKRTTMIWSTAPLRPYQCQIAVFKSALELAFFYSRSKSTRSCERSDRYTAGKGVCFSPCFMLRLQERGNGGRSGQGRREWASSSRETEFGQRRVAANDLTCIRYLQIIGRPNVDLT